MIANASFAWSRTSVLRRSIGSTFPPSSIDPVMKVFASRSDATDADRLGLSFEWEKCLCEYRLSLSTNSVSRMANKEVLDVYLRFKGEIPSVARFPWSLYQFARDSMPDLVIVWWKYWNHPRGLLCTFIKLATVLHERRSIDMLPYLFLSLLHVPRLSLYSSISQGRQTFNQFVVGGWFFEDDWERRIRTIHSSLSVVQRRSIDSRIDSWVPLAFLFRRFQWKRRQSNVAKQCKNQSNLFPIDDQFNWHIIIKQMWRLIWSFRSWREIRLSLRPACGLRKSCQLKPVFTCHTLTSNFGMNLLPKIPHLFPFPIPATPHRRRVGQTDEK